MLTSPNYPKKYDPELSCLWEITVEYGYVIELTVQDLDLERSPDCGYDSLSFSNVPNFNNSIMRLCQTQHEKTIVTSEGHKMFVKFEADESHNSKGFNLTYQQILADCGGTFSGSNGVIQTPKYPTQNYENKKMCEWNIKTDASHFITFTFGEFDLESSENCTKDFVEIYDPIFNKQLWKGCGSNLPNQTKFKSERNELVVRLVTDDSITAKGFTGNFSNSCGARIIANDSGEFQFRKIDENIECLWSIIAGDPTKKIMLTFTYSNIFVETSEGCLSRIEVFDGDSDKGSLKTTFCGSKSPPAIYSNGNAMTVKLNTSGLNYLTEFDMHYSVLDNGKTNCKFLSSHFHVNLSSMWRNIHEQHARRIHLTKLPKLFSTELLLRMEDCSKYRTQNDADNQRN